MPWDGRRTSEDKVVERGADEDAVAKDSQGHRLCPLTPRGERPLLADSGLGP